MAGFGRQAEAQTTIRISGNIYDAFDGSPIGGALVCIQSSDYSTITDRSGRFALEHIPCGWQRLEVTASGYLPASSDDIEVVSEVTRQVTICLERKTYDLGEKEVRGRIIPLNTGNLQVVNRVEIAQSDASTLADILTRMDGVYLQETGPVGGRKQISIRGCAPKHVLVLMDGQRLNPAGSSEADLGSIPLEVVERVEVYRGGESARFGTDALGGVINIITHVSKSDPRPELNFSKYWGKWKTDLHNVTVANPIRVDGLTTRFTYGYRGTNGDFDYNYSVLPRPDISRSYSGTRANADFRSLNYFASGLYQPGDKTKLGFSGQIYRARQGLPGSASQPDYTARKEDERYLGSIRLQHDFSLSHYLEVSLGLSRLYQSFDDKSGLSPYQSRHTNDIIEWQAMSRNRLWSGNELSGGVDIRRDILYHDELLNPLKSMGRTVRDNAGLFAADRQTLSLDRIPFWDIAAMDVSIRWDNTDTRKNSTSEIDTGFAHNISHWSHKVGASLMRGTKTRLIVRGSYGKSYRLPSINALFWKGDVHSQGNPDLRPERAEHSDAGIEIATDGWAQISAGLTYFHSHVLDLIVWRPSSPQGIWKPENLDASLITGHEDFVRVSLFDGRLRLRYSNTITVPQNKMSSAVFHNKYLTFRPHYVTNFDCEMRWWKFHGSYNVRLVDIRYALEANTKWYGAYRVDNAGLGFTMELAHLTIDTDYRVKNLGGEWYELIAHYPMPGREWGVNLSVSYRLE